jgi:hypothetical protein
VLEFRAFEASTHPFNYTDDTSEQNMQWYDAAADVPLRETFQCSGFFVGLETLSR